MLTQATLVRAEEVLAANRSVRRRLATAESCTGGLVAAALTAIGGSSDVVEAGFVTYSNEAKERMLGVSKTVFEQSGAVSIECAIAMAQGALVNSAADIAVSITGVAGPGGGSLEKPVGLVVFGRAVRSVNQPLIFSQRVQFQSLDRSAIRQAAVLFALDLLHPASDALASDGDIALPAP